MVGGTLLSCGNLYLAKPNASSNYLPSQKKVRNGKISGVSRKSKRGNRHTLWDFLTSNFKIAIA